MYHINSFMQSFFADSLYDNATAASASGCVNRWRWPETSPRLRQRIIIVPFSPRVSINHDLGHSSFSSQYNDSLDSSKRHFFWRKLKKAIWLILTQFRAVKKTFAFQKWGRKLLAKTDQCASFVIAQVVIVVILILVVYVFIRFKNRCNAV